MPLVLKSCLDYGTAKVFESNVICWRAAVSAGLQKHQCSHCQLKSDTSLTSESSVFSYKFWHHIELHHSFCIMCCYGQEVTQVNLASGWNLKGYAHGFGKPRSNPHPLLTLGAPVEIYQACSAPVIGLLCLKVGLM